jgi:hypothetical protein
MVLIRTRIKLLGERRHYEHEPNFLVRNITIDDPVLIFLSVLAEINGWLKFKLNVK